MKKLLLISCFVTLLLSGLQAQVIYPFDVNPAPGVQERRTWPIDSCLYFMAPADFLVRATRSAGTNQQENLVVFRSSSSSSSDFSFSGRASFIIDKNDLPAGADLSKNSRGVFLLNAPGLSEESDDWPGGEFTYPGVQQAYLESVQGVKYVDSLYAIPLQIIHFEFTDFTE